MVRTFHKVKHRTNAVKCLAFDKYANVDFGRLTNNLGGGIDGVIITKLSISPKPTQLLMRFTQKRAISTRPSNTHPALFSRHARPTSRNIYKRGRINRFMVMWRMVKKGRLIVMIFVSIAILFLASGLSFTANGSQNSGQNNTAGYVKYTLDLVNNTLINGNFVNTGNPMDPRGIAYDPSNGYIYVTDSFSGTVSVIDGTTVIANITVGWNPKGVAYDPSNGYIYVTNFYSGTVSIISTSVSTSSTSISSVTTSTTSTSTSVSTSSTSISSVTTSTTSTSTKPTPSSVTTSTTSTPSVLTTLVVVVVVVVAVSIVALLMIIHRKP